MSRPSFKAFCIEYYAEHSGQSSDVVYKIFKDTKLLDFLDSDYEDLHGMGMEYLMQLFDEYLANTEKDQNHDFVSRHNP